MAIKEITCYIAVCDGCDDQADYYDHEVDCWMNEQDATDNVGDDWKQIDGKLLCPDCIQEKNHG